MLSREIRKDGRLARIDPHSIHMPDNDQPAYQLPRDKLVAEMKRMRVKFDHKLGQEDLLTALAEHLGMFRGQQVVVAR